MVALSDPNVDSMTVTATNVRRDELRRPDLIDRENRQVREIREQVDHEHRERAENDRARQIPLAVFHFAAGEREIGPTIERPQDGDEGEAERRDRERAGREERREMSAGFRQPDGECEQNDEQESAVFRQRRDGRHGGAPSDPDDVERRCDNDRPGRRITRVAVVRRDQRVVPEDPEEVLGERDREGTDCRRANDDQLSPPEEKRGQPSPRFAQEDIDTAGFWKRAGDLRERERAAHGQQAAHDPDRQHRSRPGQSIGDSRR
jgi:hypothetical protein